MKSKKEKPHKVFYVRSAIYNAHLQTEMLHMTYMRSNHKIKVSYVNLYYEVESKLPRDIYTFIVKTSK